MAREIHTFDNGIRVYDDHLIPEQRERYRARNVHETEEEAVFSSLVQGIRPDGCFVNIGAAIGYYLILAKKISPGLKIHAVEPLQRHRRFLIENLLLNGIDPAEIHLHAVGIAGATGESLFVDRGFSSKIVLEQPGRKRFPRRALTLLKMMVQDSVLGRGGPSSHRLQRIQTISLEDLVSEVGSPIDLLQMDVQGAESEILEAAAAVLKRGEVLCFLVGTHGLKIHKACLDLLQSAGYTIETDNPAPLNQPDGIIAARKGP
jgi:FkbM family methyltransferase